MPNATAPRLRRATAPPAPARVRMVTGDTILLTCLMSSADVAARNCVSMLLTKARIGSARRGGQQGNSAASSALWPRRRRRRRCLTPSRLSPRRLRRRLRRRRYRPHRPRRRCATAVPTRAWKVTGRTAVSSMPLLGSRTQMIWTQMRGGRVITAVTSARRRRRPQHRPCHRPCRRRHRRRRRRHRRRRRRHRRRRRRHRPTTATTTTATTATTAAA